MATDESRVAQLPLDAAYLRTLPLEGDVAGRVQQIAHNLEKFQTIVLDRDAGPNMELRTAHRHIGEQLALANDVSKKIHEEFAGYVERTKPLRAENQRLANVVASLQAELAAAKAEIESLKRPEVPTNG